MKKLIFLISTFLICGYSYAYAAEPTIAIKNMQENVITLAGDTQKSADVVSLIIFNPGFSGENMRAEDYALNTSAVQYMGATYPKDGKYSFDVEMRDTGIAEGGGEYRVVIKCGQETVYNKLYEFYFNSYKEQAIRDLNTKTDADNAKTAYTRFGMSKYPIYKDTDKDKIAEALILYKESYSDKKFPINTEGFEPLLKRAALLATYNTHNAALLTKDDALLYTDILNLDGTQALADYKNNITASARKSMNAALIKNTYQRTEEITDSFKEWIAYYGIMLNKNSGTGHIDTYFENYADIYEKYGFNKNGLQENTKSRVYAALLECGAKNINELATKFNALVLNPPTGGTPQTPSRDNGGSSGSSSFKPTAPAEYIEKEKTFADIENVSWAKEAIETLLKKGIVNGRDANTFAPNDFVTRAEFLKMLVSALDFKASGNGCIFTDVSDAWAVPYVAAAYENGIAMGVTENTFEPNAHITREMGAPFMARALSAKSIEMQSDEQTFADDAEISDYAKNDIYCLKNTGIVSGVGENRFNPQGKMTRAEAATLIFRLMTFCEVDA